MASPTPSAARGWRGLRSRLSSPAAYNVLVLLIFFGGILLMVLPAELLSFEPPQKADINLKTTFGSLSSQGWLSLAFIMFGFLLMIFDVVGADLVMNMVLALCVIFKIITIKNALVGFSSSGLMTVVVLFMVAQGITSTGGAEWIVSKLLGSPTDTMLAQVRMCVITAVFSSFVNDTPVFCIMLPIVLTWAAKARLPIRQLLIPLSYCCLLGGLNTTIGTSTNLVVTGAFDARILNPTSEYYQPGLSPIQLFGVAPYGVPQTFWGIIYIVWAAPFFLTGGAGLRVYRRIWRVLFSRSRGNGTSGGALLEEQGADFFAGFLVVNDSPVVGLTIEAAGLRNLAGQYVTSVRRGGQLLHAVGSEFTLAAKDVLYLSGIPDGLEHLQEKGLVPYSDAVEVVDESEVPGLSGTFGVSAITVPRTGPLPGLSAIARGSAGSNGSSDKVGGPGAHPPELVEATLKKGADIVGKSIRVAAFRGRFHAAVVAIKRQGVPVQWSSAQIGDEVLKAEDRLLLDVAPQFWTTPEVNHVFSDITKGGQVRSHNEFLIGMRVTKLLAGKTVQAAGLRQLPNAFLASIDRGAFTIHAVAPEEVLEAGDVLWFAGNAASVRFLRNTPGLQPLAERQASRLRGTSTIERRLVQAIVARDSPLAGKSIRDLQFRQQFNAAVVAVARKGERIRAKPGDVVLEAGDILLLDTGGAFALQNRDSPYFSVIIELPDSNPPRYLHTAIAIASIAAAFILYALEILDILPGATIVVAIMLLTGCMSPEQARKAIRWDVYLMIAGSFGVSAALEQSGGAAAIGNAIVDIGRNAGGGNFTISAVYIATALLSQIIANNSAAALMFPIAATISKNEGTDIYLLSYAIMLGASSVFMSSFGYQTNLMALAAGGHSSRDFLKFGSPMQIVLAVVAIVSLISHEQWLLVWGITALACVVLLGLPQVVETVNWWRERKQANTKA